MSEQPSRLVSLDAFRGATIAGMILVNNPGTWSAIYPQLGHAKWNGWTFTDWIFPFFLFIVGVAMVFSFAKRKESGAGKADLYKQIFKRSLKIFALGIFLNGFPFGLLFGHEFNLATMRIPGVLQRIAVCFFIVGVVYLNTSLRSQLALIVTLLAGYWMLLTLVPVPGYGAGVLEPQGNLAWYVDSNLLAGHTWSGAPAPGFDPEGILSTLGAIATTLCGIVCGQFIRSNRSQTEKTAWMFVAGNALLLLGAIVDIWMPINKNLWTSSYVVFMAGWALVCLAMFSWLIDVQGHKKWAMPFVHYGMNAIAVFVLSGVVARCMGLIRFQREDGSVISLKNWIFESLFVPMFPTTVQASTAFAVAFIMVMYLVVWGMYKKKWFIKV